MRAAVVAVTLASAPVLLGAGPAATSPSADAPAPDPDGTATTTVATTAGADDAGDGRAEDRAADGVADVGVADDGVADDGADAYLGRYDADDVQRRSQPGAQTATYCVRLTGVASSERDPFAAAARRILTDIHSWTLGGSLRFVERSSCDGTGFTLWLAAPDRVPTFSSVCSSRYSCRVGRDVIINHRNWHHATPAWNQAGGNLTDYRRMVVNHEVGHWLGFGHYDCRGRGQPAPVMQQQSISLQGCQPNGWPVGFERDALAQRRGLAQLSRTVDDGDVVQVEGRGTRYYVEDGVRRALPDDQTLRDRRPDGAVRWVSPRNVSQVPTGTPVPSVTRPDDAFRTLLQDADGGPIYLVRDGQRFELPDACTFDERGYWRSDVRERTADELADIPVGGQVPTACWERTAPPTQDTAPACDDVEDGRFDDTAGTTHEDTIDCAADRGLVRGDGGSFAPNVAVTRGQLASIVVAYLDEVGAPAPPADEVDDAFVDDDGSVHEPAIDRLAATGIVTGVGEDRFAPNAPVTRGQLATFLTRTQARVLEVDGFDWETDWFVDDVDDTHEPAIDQAADLGLVGGVGDHRFAPGRDVRRGELATTIVRALAATEPE